MSKHNQQGLTLVEVLAVIIILSIIFTFIFSIMNSSISQHSEQGKEVQQIQSGAYILKQITKDMRKSYRIEINANKYYLYNKEKLLYQYEYTSNAELLRTDENNDVTVVGKNIESFLISTDNEGKEATIFFEINGKEYRTTINFRRGGS
ncbi:PilW family protein [Ureibacillus thermosphaericus]|uniref:PilW family protein n=1 Tax=Ureibacillus thermosphaericus TaxID=51173 RepID=UPI000BBCCE1B|nr:type II secretion system protein [Ureibacillus thermosphaericus]